MRNQPQMMQHMQPALTGEELAVLMRNKTPENRQRVMLAYIPAVYKCLHFFSPVGWRDSHEEDLISEGMIGLWESIDRWDPNHASQCSFLTYAMNGILFQMRNYLRSHVAVVKMSEATQHALFNGELEGEALQKAQSALHPGSLDFTYRGAVDQGPVRGPRRAGIPNESLHYRDTEQDDLLDLREALERAKPKMSPLQWEALHGFINCGNMGIVARQINRSRERARQLKEQALVILRHEMGVESCPSVQRSLGMQESQLIARLSKERPSNTSRTPSSPSTSHTLLNPTPLLESIKKAEASLRGRSPFRKGKSGGKSSDNSGGATS
jgi:RNA polymerase sigma factor (sigma-70 family)